MSFFSATLHSPEILDLGKQLCFYPIWVDLKGKDSIPDYVHHVVCRVAAPESSASAVYPQGESKHMHKKTKRSASIGSSGDAGAASTSVPMEICTEERPAARPQSSTLRAVLTFTDRVHASESKGKELISQTIKENKQKILLEIVDKFEVILNHSIICHLN